MPLWYSTVSPKIGGIILENKILYKLKLSKMCYKQCGPKLIFFIEKNEKDTDVFKCDVLAIAL